MLSSAKKNDLLSHGKSGRKRKRLLLSERSESEKSDSVAFQLDDILEKA